MDGKLDFICKVTGFHFGLNNDSRAEDRLEYAYLCANDNLLIKILNLHDATFDFFREILEGEHVLNMLYDTSPMLNAFDWKSTKDGYSFWYRLHNNYRHFSSPSYIKLMEVRYGKFSLM